MEAGGQARMGQTRSDAVTMVQASRAPPRPSSPKSTYCLDFIDLLPRRRPGPGKAPYQPVRIGGLRLHYGTRLRSTSLLLLPAPGRLPLFLKKKRNSKMFSTPWKIKTCRYTPTIFLTKIQNMQIYLCVLCVWACSIDLPTAPPATPTNLKPTK